MPTMRRDGVQLWYEEAGTGSPALLLVHGFCGNHTHMSALFDHFRRSRRVVSVDRRGHGQSDKPEQAYSVAGFADDLVFLTDELGLHRPVVVVHSQDKIGLDLAARYPDRISGVVLLDGAGFVPAELTAQFEQALGGLRSPAYKDVIAGLGGSLGVSDAIIGEMVQLPQHVIVSTWEAYITYDAAQAAAAISAPILSVRGVFPEDTDRFRQLAPQLVTGQVTGTGHFVMLDAPDQVIALMDPFLASLPTPVAR